MYSRPLSIRFVGLTGSNLTTKTYDQQATQKASAPQQMRLYGGYQNER